MLIRNALPEEFSDIGKLMMCVYSSLEGFPKQHEQPDYYDMLSKVGDLTQRPGTELVVAIEDNNIAGAVVFISNMEFYGQGIAKDEKEACAFRLLAVNPQNQRQGIGKILINECIKRARKKKAKQVIIHSTKAMPVAWNMYEKIGFKRSEDLDFVQVGFPVYGFRLHL